MRKVRRFGIHIENLNKMPKDKIVKLKEGEARVKPLKTLGKDEDGNIVQSQAIKSTEQVGKHKLKNKRVNRYVGGKLVSTDHIPTPIKPKKIKLKKVRVPRKLKKVKVPEYTSPPVTLDEDDLKELEKRERIANAKKKKKKKKLKIKLPKFKKRKKRRKTKNLVTGKYNYTQ